jgi:hypothetical protein
MFHPSFNMRGGWIFFGHVSYALRTYSISNCY